MAWLDFRDFIGALEERGEVRHVEGASCDVEIGTLTELMCERQGPMLLFDAIQGYPTGYRIAAKPYATVPRAVLALGLPEDQSPFDLLRVWRARIRDYRPLPVERVATGPVMENVLEGDDVDLTKFPTPRWHQRDGGRFLGTGCGVITRDPETGWVNVGAYREMVHDRTSTGVEIQAYHDGRLQAQKYWAEGKPCPIAVAIGPDPYLFLAASNRLPWGSSELEFAGFVRGAPEEVILGPRTGLPLPARAEIILEGEMPPPSEESRLEGPFGEFTGYYAGGEKMQPVIHVQAIYHRDNPIIHGDPPLKPPLNYWGLPVMGTHLEVWDTLERAGVQGLKGTYAFSGGGSLVIVIALKQQYAGHASAVGRMASGIAKGLNHLMILVDEDVDPSDVNEVLWAIATRSDPATAWEIYRDIGTSPVDPTISPERKKRGDCLASRAVINACRPWAWIKEFPPVNRASDEERERVLAKWAHLFRGETSAERALVGAAD